MISCTPAEAEFLAYCGPERWAALSLTLLADGETPISLFRRLAGDRPDAVLLESVEGGELMGRYSFIVAGAEERFTFADERGVVEVPDGEGGMSARAVEFDDPLDVLRQRLRSWTVWSPAQLPRFHGGAVGYLGFDCICYFEDLPLPSGPGLGHPDGRFLFARELYIYDHVSRRLILVTHVPLEGDRRTAYATGVARLEKAMARLYEGALPPDRPWALGPDELAAASAGNGSAAGGEWTANRTREDFEAAVESAREAIGRGEVFQVVISQRLTVETALDPLELYRALRALNPSPYMFLLRFDDFAVVGASPEVLVRVEDGEILLRPIAGTRPRGATPAEEAALEADLLSDEKELAEHRMLVDLGRNDVGRVAEIGSVLVEEPLHIERYSHVVHMVSDVRGRVDADQDCFDVLRACFPAGTVSGAPKIRACELLAELEPDRRGLYAGAVGYFGAGGNMDMCIAIRTMLVEPHRVHTQAGAGIVWDSDPAREYEECLHKARSGLTAIRLAAARRVP